ncbi:MAG: SAM-dependent DNA methyltransferase, partial [Desulfobacterales bacterium]|nr:SAM-dependent DNA methyltransferase [Desulfobacterales bacterium]
MNKHTTDAGLDAIRIEGGLLSSSVLHLLRRYELPGQTPAEYGIEKGLKLSDELGRYWRIAQARQQDFSELQNREDLDLQKVTVDDWLLPFFTRVLGYRIEETKPIQIGERIFPITRASWDGAVPLLFVSAERSLEKGDPLFGQEGSRRSPAGLMQEYLNAETRSLWAIVSNGHVLRLLRDNPAMTRPAYIEIDLTRIFQEELYVDFTVCWLLLQATRLAPREERPENCLLEQWRNQGQVDGERVLGELRFGVTNALRILGAGFVAHSDNQALREAIQSRALSTDAYFQELLRLIYRFLFLLTTEDRGILLDPDADEASKKLYHDGYSVAVLRDRSRFR